MLNLKAQKNDTTKDLKPSCAKSSNAQMDTVALKSELSSNKKRVGNCEHLQNERHTLKGETSLVLIKLDFTNEHYAQAHDQVDHLLKSKH